MPPLRICLVSAELTPFAKTGGLGDVTAALAGALAAKGHDVRVFVPFYATLDRREQPFLPVGFVQDVAMTLAHRSYRFSLQTTALPRSGLPLYFVDCPALFHRASLYTHDWDEPIRFAAFTRAALESCQRMGWSPQVLHVNDWHTALGPLALHSLYSWDRLFAATKTVLTIHNIGYQGVFPGDALEEIGLGFARDQLAREDREAGVVNFLRTGIRHADVLTTVSRTYAREIQTPEYGAGLDGILRWRADRLAGIVNGVDYGEWDPAHDLLIPQRYTADDLAGKERCKQELLHDLGMPYREGVPLAGIVSRLAPQKGFDLVFESLPGFLATRPLQLVVLASGDRHQEHRFWELQQRFPGQVCFWRGYSNELAHRIEAGADLFLMPSLYEPCGLNQMYSLRYGTVPIVRKTGGLADTVEPYEAYSGKGTGFVFEHYDPAGLSWALDYALQVYGDRERWRTLQRNGMRQDFSWDRQVGEYEALYRWVTGVAE